MIIEQSRGTFTFNHPALVLCLKSFDAPTEVAKTTILRDLTILILPFPRIHS